jgi:hypothetical protein
MIGRHTTRSYFDTATATGDLPWEDIAIQAINNHVHGDMYYSGGTILVWREGSMRFPWGDLHIQGPNARRLGKRELKQMIETPLKELLPTQKYTGMMRVITNNGEVTGKPECR